MNRRRFLQAGAAAAAVPLVGCLTRDGQPGRRPNVLMLFSDDQRASTIHALGNDLIQTPNLDRLAARGIAFTHAHIMGSTGGAVCVCSRAMLMTGRSIWRAPNNLAAPLPIWTETMKQAGYTTFGIGKWHNGPASYARGFTGGDRIFFGGMSDHLKVPVNDFDPSGKYPGSKTYTGEAFSSEMFSSAAVRFLRGYKDEKPFFLYVAYTAPHDPRMPPKEFADLYDPEKIPLPKNFMPQHPFDNGDLKGRDEALLPWPRDPAAVRREIALYYGMISHLDAHIGRVLDALRETGRDENTIIIFAGDNGLALGQHGLMGKQSLYEHSIRVPLIISAPGVCRPGSRSDALVYLLDVFPTVCELTGVRTPEGVESRSLVPLMKNPAGAGYDSLFAAYMGIQRMVRTDRWKLIWYPKVPKFQLFDILADPDEMNDLSDRPDHADRMTEMKKKLAEWQRKTGDRLPV